MALPIFAIAPAVTVAINDAAPSAATARGLACDALVELVGVATDLGPPETANY